MSVKPTHFKNPVNGRIFIYTDILAKHKGLIPLVLDENGEYRELEMAAVERPDFKPAYLKHKENGRIFPYDEKLAKNKNMIGLTQEAYDQIMNFQEGKPVAAFVDAVTGETADTEELEDGNETSQSSETMAGPAQGTETGTEGAEEASDFSGNGQDMAGEGNGDDGSEADVMTLDDIENAMESMRTKDDLVAFSQRLFDDFVPSKEENMATMRMAIMTRAQEALS